MDLFIDRDALSRGLSRIQGIIERRSTEIILSHVLLHARDGSLRLTATDSEVAYIGEIESSVNEPGELSVDASNLFAVIRSLPEATVHLQVTDGNRLQIRSGRARFNLVGSAADEFPALPVFDPMATASLSESDFRRMIDQVYFAVSTEDVRWGLNGAHMEQVEADGQPKIRMVATDGHRLSVSESTFTGEFAFSAKRLVPRKALTVLRKLLDGRDQQVELRFGDGAMQLVRPGQTFWFRLLEGDFPDYKSVIPSGNKHHAMVRRADLSGTLKRVSILVPDKSRPVRFGFGATEVEIRVQNVDRGDVTETLPIELEGEPIAVGFNARYVQDILGVIRGDQISMELAHPLAPCLIRDPNNADAQFVVMPMRLD